MKLSAILTLLGTAIGTAGAALAPACAQTLPPTRTLPPTLALTATATVAPPLAPTAPAPTIGAPGTPVQVPGVVLADGDDGQGGWPFFGLGQDDDDDDEDDEDDDGCAGGDDDAGGGSGCTGKVGGKTRGNAAPAGSVAPPKNGLFGDGKPPAVKTN